MKKSIIFIVSILLNQFGFSQLFVKEFKIEKQYLNFPINKNEARSLVKFVVNNDTLTYSVIRITDKKPDYWVFKDVAALKGKTLKLVLPKEIKGLDQIYQADTFTGEDSLYKEVNRPQFHFSTRRGWVNDPNGLVYNNGEYHLFYQHNPYEIDWENMHWGHAVSKDLLHWTELNDALYPDTLGTIFSGSAVVDKNNSAGWGKEALVAFYTTAGKKMQQNVAYSNDNGRSFTKFKGNPILGPDRDPKVFWYAPTQTWVMALYNENYVALYNSKDLKKWDYRSKTFGFYECPEFFELAIDGNQKNKKWVMVAASGTYMLGSFDGSKFKPEAGKYFYTWGTQYAAQTYNNTPDGKRIQIGWGRIDQIGMPYNQMMLFPNELSLRTTREGVRLFCEPIKQVSQLHEKKYVWNNISTNDLNKELKKVQSDLLHITMDIEMDKGVGMEIHFKGSPIIYYDGNFNRINGAPYVNESPTSFRFNIEILLDKNSVEGYIDHGKLHITEALKNPKNSMGIEVVGDVKIHSFEIAEMKSIWK
jgi:sucrose-6-phosphate hydrolase SacC (GH32 family)